MAMWKPLCVWDGPAGQAALNCKEALPSAFQHLWTLAVNGRTEPLAFHDLGCGYGSLIVLAHVLKGSDNFNISRATGTEIRVDLRDAFMRWLHDFEAVAPLFASAVDEIRQSFILADMTSPTSVASRLAVRQADIIWCNNMLFPPDLKHAVAHMLQQCMSEHAIVVSTAKLEYIMMDEVADNQRDHDLVTYNRFMFPTDSMSWTGNGVPGFMSRLSPRDHDHDHDSHRRKTIKQRQHRQAP